MRKRILISACALCVLIALLFKNELLELAGHASTTREKPVTPPVKAVTLLGGPTLKEPEFREVGYLRRPPMSEEESLAAEPVFPPGFDEYSDWEEHQPLPTPPSSLVALLGDTKNPDTLSDPDRREMFELFRNWGRAANGEAITYALDGLKGETRLDLALAAFDGWAEKDIAEAADFASTLTTAGSDYVNFAIPMRYLEKDREGAVDWAVNRSPQLYRNHVMQHTIIEWNRGNDGADSAAWVTDHLDGRDRLQIHEQTAVREVTEHLVRQDFEKAKAFISSLNSLEGQQAGVGVLIDHWANEDVEAASTWLEEVVASAGTMATDGSYDAAYRVMAFRLVETDVEAAQRWVDRICDDSDYESLVNQLSMKLMHSQ